MITFVVEDMTCAHCEATLRKALMALDPESRVSINLANHTVQVESERTDAKGIAQVIESAGYTPRVG